MRIILKTLLLLVFVSNFLYSCSALKTPSKENDSAMKKNVEALQKKQDAAVPVVDFQTYKENKPK